MSVMAVNKIRLCICAWGGETANLGKKNGILAEICNNLPKMGLNIPKST